MNFQEIAALIQIKNFAFNAIDNISIKLSREEQKALMNKLSHIDNCIVSHIVAMKLPNLPEAVDKAPGKKNAPEQEQFNK